MSYKGNSIQLSPYFSAATLEARREWQGMFKVLKERNLQPKIVYLQGYSELKERWSFPDKQKLKKLVTIKPALQEH